MRNIVESIYSWTRL